MVSRNIWENESKFCVFSISTTSLQELITESVEKLTWKVSFFQPTVLGKTKPEKNVLHTRLFFNSWSWKRKKGRNSGFSAQKLISNGIKTYEGHIGNGAYSSNWFIKCRHPTIPQCEKMRNLLLRINFSWKQCDENCTVIP